MHVKGVDNKNFSDKHVQLFHLNVYMLVHAVMLLKGGREMYRLPLPWRVLQYGVGTVFVLLRMGDKIN